MLEHVNYVSPAKQIYENICNVFKPDTLLNKLRARQDFYTLKMMFDEKILCFIIRVQQAEQNLKLMDVNGDGKETAMAILNGLPSQFKHIITTFDAVGGDSSVFTLDVVISRLLQEEQHQNMCLDNASELVLFSSRRSSIFPIWIYYCNYCKRRGHMEHRC